MIAFLGMYDMPYATAATDALWRNISETLDDAPNDLTRGGDAWDIWQNPDLLLAQTCGLPYRAHLHAKVQLVGTPDYAIEGCPPGFYRSVIVVRKDDPAQALCDLEHRNMAYNEGLSQSGWAAPVAHFKQAGIAFETGPATGGHALSAQSVAEGHADFAALDALTWRMLHRQDPALVKQLRVIDKTVPTPGLPYITSHSADADMIARAVQAGIKATTPEDLGLLHLKGLVHIPKAAYLALDIPKLP
ncbi:PhnD/SsuA/transferrin family substrate-binding protein [Ascidiaceihabitans sp.]|uniref:phosphate/phosphite/phosphonate ABC transporter substrate-binding protein n=1 Tax=Ascidiaceihabitans sp. TaxID=1872644 RepID=UPI003299D73B